MKLREAGTGTTRCAGFAGIWNEARSSTGGGRPLAGAEVAMLDGAGVDPGTIAPLQLPHLWASSWFSTPQRGQ
ncbi:hypothetical protein [Pseudomonas sp.]|uniref:hypothetical protein n=1 Tax=Pseudomonas sp. TaxID=306 RepID=UPI0028ACEF60|nr:hypothetical protein [Pseudomonas sp.]